MGPWLKVLCHKMFDLLFILSTVSDIPINSNFTSITFWSVTLCCVGQHKVWFCAKSTPRCVSHCRMSQEFFSTSCCVMDTVHLYSQRRVWLLAGLRLTQHRIIYFANISEKTTYLPNHFFPLIRVQGEFDSWKTNSKKSRDIAPLTTTKMECRFLMKKQSLTFQLAVGNANILYNIYTVQYITVWLIKKLKVPDVLFTFGV